MTLTIEELRFRRQVCSTCQFNNDGKCSKLDENIRMAVFFPDCPEGLWEANENYPKLTQQLKTFASSMANWVKNGLTRVPEEIYDKRLLVCKSCEFWDGKALKGTGRCRKCGCSTWAKLRLASEKCPIDKWGRYEN